MSNKQFKHKRTARPARPGYDLVVDHEATKKYGRRMLKWVPNTSVAKEGV